MAGEGRLCCSMQWKLRLTKFWETPRFRNAPLRGPRETMRLDENVYTWFVSYCCLWVIYMSA